MKRFLAMMLTAVMAVSLAACGAAETKPAIDEVIAICFICSAGAFLYNSIVGKTVCDNASYAIFCYEDPRSEDPRDIIDMMVKDINDKSKYEIVPFFNFFISISNVPADIPLFFL